jgi:hypothetical protein
MVALLSSLLLALAMIRCTTATGVYNSSTTPSSLPWNTYNYCNAPHVNIQHYTTPKESDIELVYLNVVMRHHKARPSLLNRFCSEHTRSVLPTTSIQTKTLLILHQVGTVRISCNTALVVAELFKTLRAPMYITRPTHRHSTRSSARFGTGHATQVNSREAD